MDKSLLKKELNDKMTNSLKVLDHELKGLRTGRASINFLDIVTVEAYGERMHLHQVSSLTTPDARTIAIQVWDKALVKAIEKSIVEANLGVTPNVDGQLIRVVMPILTEERRKELVKLAHKYAENSKISIRNVRRDANEDLKKMEKDNLISKDEHHNLSDEIQKITDDFTKKIDDIIKQKEVEIMKV
jgi:ribosome recycling factor